MNDHVWHALTGLGIMVSGISFSVSWLKGYQKPVVGKPKSTRYFRSQLRKAHVTLGLKSYTLLSLETSRVALHTWKPSTRGWGKRITEFQLVWSTQWQPVWRNPQPTTQILPTPHCHIPRDYSSENHFFKKVINSLDLTGTFKDKQEYLKGKGFYFEIRNPLHKYPAFQENKKLLYQSATLKINPLIFKDNKFYT